MKMGLKVRLILSYTMLSLLLVLSLLVISNTLLERQFRNYMIGKQEEKNETYVSAVLTEFEAGKSLSEESFLALGQKALNEGMILMIKDKLDQDILCMSCYDNRSCENMIDAMEQTMEARYPGFEGAYTEKIYLLSKGDVNYGTVTLGYYGPYYLLDADMRFMDVLNQLFMVSGVGFLFIAIGLGYFMAVRISRPIGAVTQKTRQIEGGDFGCRIDFESNTKEIQGLISSVNALASTLQAQQAIKKRMAGDYAHEFRTPLAAIQSNLEGIMDGIFEPTNDRLEGIHVEILRLSRMVSQIDKLVELENDTIPTSRERFDLGTLLRQTVSPFEAELKEKSITLRVDTVPCELTAHRDQISSLIVNLLSNAIKYTDKNGTISITLQNSKSHVVLTVQDSGMGIAKKDIPHIFEHLYRTDTSRTRETGGSGIGLSVVKAIVAAHGGDLDVKSQVGSGSVFTVSLPKEPGA